MNRCPSNKKPILAFRLYKVIIIMIAIILVLSYLYQNSALFYRKTITLPFSQHLNKQDVYLIKGEEFRLYVFAINKRVSYSSTNFRVAGVNFNGRVFAHQTGKAFIIAKVDKKLLKCRIHVIDINRESLALRIGDSYRLKVKGSNAFVHWKSSDKNVATVSMLGKVKAKNRGSTVVYAKIKGKILKCSINVE